MGPTRAGKHGTGRCVGPIPGSMRPLFKVLAQRTFSAELVCTAIKQWPLPMIFGLCVGNLTSTYLAVALHGLQCVQSVRNVGERRFRPLHSDLWLFRYGPSRQSGTAISTPLNLR